MKKISVSILGMLVLLFVVTKVQSQTATAVAKKVLPMTTKSALAKELATKATGHFMNIEFAEAYRYFSDALKADPNFTYAQVFMTYLTRGDVAKKYAASALKSSQNKSEGEKLFASTVKEKNTDSTNRAIWTRLHKLYPDCDLVGNYYTYTRATADERFAAAQAYIKQFPKNGWMYNTLGYFYMNDKKDMEAAKKNFEKYIELYPKGCNPYDSMGEYYLNNGDLDNAEKYYSKALEAYPFANSSLNALDKIKAEKDKKKSNE